MRRFAGVAVILVLSSACGGGGGSGDPLGDCGLNGECPDGFICSVDDNRCYARGFAPETTLTSTPPSLTNVADASFAFTSTVSRFQCRVDTAAFSICTSPHSATVV